MTLYEMVNKTKYHLPVWIYETNDYDQNIPLFKGTVEEAREEGDLIWDYLMYQVDGFDYEYGILDIRVITERHTELFRPTPDKHTIKSKRNWHHSYEIEEEKKLFLKEKK